ncbi:hypothetical protein SAY86_017115 [Trapa natans]|uniref:Uncharacterized protein n=1 Tax=Trapa natans TaxID=22666 RepID=A0AAN7R738_TRANT|nr:hypothetical protein SAY86_017115 [Trapa natans]
MISSSREMKIWMNSKLIVINLSNTPNTYPEDCQKRMRVAQIIPEKQERGRDGGSRRAFPSLGISLKFLASHLNIKYMSKNNQLFQEKVIQMMLVFLGVMSRGCECGILLSLSPGALLGLEISDGYTTLNNKFTEKSLSRFDSVSAPRLKGEGTVDDPLMESPPLTALRWDSRLRAPLLGKTDVCVSLSSGKMGGRKPFSYIRAQTPPFSYQKFVQFAVDEINRFIYLAKS